MPLVRYQVQCEHSLANPELYRSAGQDDSEGLLEGVATAGLVGIVRQLGDLAEFAAEIFRDLHDDIMAMASRRQSLKARVARLEVDMPAMEKALLAKSTQLQFAYRKRFKWRAPLPMDRKVFVDGELPRFVQNLYDDCRGPPRLFLLDKFDEAGRGACMKRYTDVTFFRLSWAASLVAKAEQQQRAREAELLEKSAAGANADGSKIYPRERLSSALFENLEGFTGDFIPELWSRRMDGVSKLSLEGVLTPEEPRSPEHKMLPKVAEGPVLAPLKIRANLGHRVVEFNDEALSEDASSDAEVYVDALTTMGSDPDSEPGSRTRWEADSIQNWLALEFESESPNHSVLNALVEAHRCTPSRKHVEHDEDFMLGEVGTGFDAVREWEDIAERHPGEALDFVEVSLEDMANIIEDSPNRLAIVTHNVPQEETLPSPLPDEPPDYLSDKLPYTLPDTPSDNLSDKLPYTLPDTPSDNLSDKLPDTTLSNALPDKPAHSLLDKLPDTFSNMLPDERLDVLVPLSDHPTELPNKASDKSSVKTSDKTSSNKLPKKPLKGKLSSAPPNKPLVRRFGKLSDKPPEKSPKKPTAKRPEKPTYQSHGSVALLDSFRPSVRVKSIVASLEAREQSAAVENSFKPPPPVENSSSPATTPRSRRQWEKNNATQIHSSILQLADVDINTSSELNDIFRARSLESDKTSHVNITGTALDERIAPSNVSSPNTTISSVVEDEEGYSSSGSSSLEGLPKFCVLLSPSASPPRVVEGSMFVTSSCFDRKAPRAPPITPFLADSPSVSRSSSVHVKPNSVYSAPKDFMLRSSVIQGAVACDSDKLMNVFATSPTRKANENGGSSFSNPAPRPRTWVNRSESNVAATLQAIRQAAAVASDNDTGSECRSNCE